MTYRVIYENNRGSMHEDRVSTYEEAARRAANLLTQGADTQDEQQRTYRVSIEKID